jgi:hypothetical protein
VGAAQQVGRPGAVSYLNSSGRDDTGHGIGDDGVVAEETEVMEPRPNDPPDALPTCGPYRDYWPNGVLACEGEYVGGAQAGQWRFYNRDGTLREVVRFAGGREIPPWVDPLVRGEGADA